MQGKNDFGGIIGLQDNQMSDWQRRFEERGLRFEGAAVRYQPLPPTCHPERSEGSRYVAIVIHRLINTSRQGG